ncbi:Cysteine synthase [Alkalibacterium sp. AK22]|uniref:cysteine synthase A n=1 Tax=Alkalibacterium sp. AK22 TaxID=1229520 RepID=UPI0004471482|nr:cysteine synthase A [Alkalibacterium sp. AK22]EXJ24399.1 Cysteine synthase [Alkalibacterium sp. AK22]
MKVVNNVTELIGETPLLKLNRVVPEGAAEVYAKMELSNVGGSVKDRIALNMIEAAEKEGKLKEGDTIVEATSGNTGVGLAMVSAAKGYKTHFIMPDTLSKERRALMKAYGAELELTPGDEGMPGAMSRARELAEQNHYFMPSQFTNPANPAVHISKTGPEIIEALNGETPDAFVAGVGTGGTITGVGKALKLQDPSTQIIAVEPEESAVLSGREKGKHKIQGMGAGFIPDILDRDIYDEVLTVTSEEAIEMTKRLAREEGLLVGISAGANILAATRVAEKLGSGKKVVTIACDTGERYLSTPVFSIEEQA